MSDVYFVKAKLQIEHLPLRALASLWAMRSTKEEILVQAFLERLWTIGQQLSVGQGLGTSRILKIGTSRRLDPSTA
jgi:hypothetical protein